MRFQSRMDGVQVEAIQFDGTLRTMAEIYDRFKIPGLLMEYMGDKPKVLKFNGQIADPGAWVIRTGGGYCYVGADSWFKKNFVPVGEAYVPWALSLAAAGSGASGVDAEYKCPAPGDAGVVAGCANCPNWSKCYFHTGTTGRLYGIDWAKGEKPVAAPANPVEEKPEPCRFEGCPGGTRFCEPPAKPEAKPVNTPMNFGLALECLKKGQRVRRRGQWPKNVWLRRLDLYCDKEFAVRELGNAYGFDSGTLRPAIWMHTVDNKLTPWMASHEGLLAEDWVVVE